MLLFNGFTEHNREVYKQAGIYLIYQNNGMQTRYYIGSAKCFRDRIYSHRTKLNCKKHDNAFIQNCFNKYGKDTLYIQILSIVTGDTETELETNLAKEEQLYLNKYIEWGFTVFNVEKNTDRKTWCKGIKRSQVTVNRNRRNKQKFVKTEYGKYVLENATNVAAEVNRKPTPELINVLTKEVVPSYPSRRELAKAMNWEKKLLSGLFTGKLLHYKGYVIKSDYPHTLPPDIEDRIKYRTFTNSHKTKKLVNIDTGEIIEEQLSIRKLAHLLNLNTKCLGNLMCGQIEIYKNWKLYKEE